MDLTQATTIDPVGLGAIVRTRESARRCGGELVLAAPSRYVRTVLHAMRLEAAFPKFDTVPQAMSTAVAQPGWSDADRRQRERGR